MLLAAIRIVRTFSVKLRDDSISAFAAQAAFFIILSFFPFVMFLLSLLNLLSFRTVTVLAALWSASRGMLALVRGLNAVYGLKETRNYFHVRAVSMVYTLCFAALLIATLILLVFGNRLYHFVITRVPLLGDLALLIMSLRSLVTMAILTIFFLLMYLVIPNRKSKLLCELPGALLTAGGWLGFSYLFSFYIDYMQNYAFTYGSLTTLAICMLWLYFCMYILFVGAEINVFLFNGKDT